LFVAFLFFISSAVIASANPTLSLSLSKTEYNFLMKISPTMNVFLLPRSKADITEVQVSLVLCNSTCVCMLEASVLA